MTSEQIQINTINSKINDVIEAVGELECSGDYKDMLSIPLRNGQMLLRSYRHRLTPFDMMEEE